MRRRLRTICCATLAVLAIAGCCAQVRQPATSADLLRDAIAPTGVIPPEGVLTPVPGTAHPAPAAPGALPAAPRAGAAPDSSAVRPPAAADSSRRTTGRR